MKTLLVFALTLWLSVALGAGQSAMKPTKISEKELSLASVLLSPYDGNTVLLSKDLKRDLAAYVSSLPEVERLLMTASTVVEGTRPNILSKQDRLTNPNGAPKGLILMWIAEHHGASLIFDGSKITFHFLGTPLREDRRWYAVCSTLLAAFAEAPVDGTADPIKAQDAKVSIEKNTAGIFREIKVVMANDTGTKIQLSGPTPTLDALERWMSNEFLKLTAKDKNSRRMPGPVGIK